MNTKERKEYVIVTLVTLPASHSYRLSEGNDSLLKVLAQPGPGSIIVNPEGTPLEHQQMENFSFVDLLGAS